MKNISIIGLGWIGLPLAKALLEQKYEVIGSTTSEVKAEKIQSEGIRSIQFSLDPHPQGTGFHALFQTEILVVNIPPRSRQDGGEKYLEQLKFLKELISNSPIQKVLYVSSTGVYPEKLRSFPYTEQEEINSTDSGNPNLWKAENYLKEQFSHELCILRFGGLLGQDRIPGKYFSGKENVVGHTRVNFIHQTDAVRLMQFIIHKELWGQTFNGVAPMHPLRKEVYEKNAQELKIAPPKSYQSESDQGQRIVSGEKIIQAGFEFLYPNPLDFPYAAKE